MIMSTVQSSPTVEHHGVLPARIGHFWEPEEGIMGIRATSNSERLAHDDDAEIQGYRTRVLCSGLVPNFTVAV